MRNANTWCKVFCVLCLVSIATSISSGTLATKPSWVGITSAVTIERQESGYVVKMIVTYMNNSRNGAVLRQIYDKSLRLKGTLYLRDSEESGRYTIEKPFDCAASFSKSSHITVYPGQSTKLDYTFDLIKGAHLTQEEINLINLYGVKFTQGDWLHDFQVKVQ